MNCNAINKQMNAENYGSEQSLRLKKLPVICLEADMESTVNIAA